MISLQTITKTSGVIESTEGLPIRHDVYTQQNVNPGELPVIVFCYPIQMQKRRILL